MPTPRNPIETVLDYHSQTKHHLHRFAASLGYLDWATQPDPFRTYDGTERVELPLSAERLIQTSYRNLYSSTPAPLEVNQDSVAALFELALGLSAWKQYGDTKWSLRCNPSSGNLHPTEGYAVLPRIPGMKAGVYHYVSRDHCLERRCTLDGAAEDRLTGMLSGRLLVGLSSIHWREAWKYGERAFRYCQHDIGHAIATVRYAAAAIGWKAWLLDISDPAIGDILGLTREEDFAGIDALDREHPDVVLLVGPGNLAAAARNPAIDTAGIREVVKAGMWTGRPNTLSPSHTPWTAIDIASQAAWRSEAAVSSGVPATGDDAVTPPSLMWSDTIAWDRLRAVNLIKQRRSAVALDDATSIPVETFYGMLDRLLPRPGVAPWDVLPWKPHVHCGIFVHRVDGLAPGFYLFLRNTASQEMARTALSHGFAFERPAGCPPHLSLFKLTEGDFRKQAQVISCQQKIAGAGAFSLGMLAEYGESVRSTGAWWYRRLFWEAGVLGQVLYLEAEAAGVRGTGIGCYFDDPFHALLGLRDDQLQSLYHFTVGGPVEDGRLMTLPAYAHLNVRQ